MPVSAVLVLVQAVTVQHSYIRYILTHRPLIVGRIASRPGCMCEHKLQAISLPASVSFVHVDTVVGRARVLVDIVDTLDATMQSQWSPCHRDGSCLIADAVSTKETCILLREGAVVKVCEGSQHVPT